MGEDGLTLTLKLKQGVKSCDGNEMTADDVVYTFARAKSVAGAAPVGWFLGSWPASSGLPARSQDGDRRLTKTLKDEVIEDRPVHRHLQADGPERAVP